MSKLKIVVGLAISVAALITFLSVAQTSILYSSHQTYQNKLTQAADKLDNAQRNLRLASEAPDSDARAHLLQACGYELKDIRKLAEKIAYLHMELAVTQNEYTMAFNRTSVFDGLVQKNSDEIVIWSKLEVLENLHASLTKPSKP